MELMKLAVAGRARIKASGGIRTREAALEMIAAGADPVSYTHLDVYKRQAKYLLSVSAESWFIFE